jgi:ABC-2 type transport system permease protein
MRALVATLRSAGAEVRANRSSFWAQIATMIVNDLAWVVFWSLFFGGVGSLRGWDVERVLLLQAVYATAGGLSLGLFGNARRIGPMALDGGFDAVLALPVPPLAHVLVRRIEAVNLGDILFGVTMFVIVGHPSPGRAVTFAAVVVAGALVLTGFLVAAGSLAFFLGRSESGDLGFHSIMMMSAYPADIFSGVPRMLVYGLVPAAFVSTVPATLVDTADPRLALALAVAAVVSVGVGWATFTFGLRRYTSGSIWTRA